jgi:hypothetical protein
MMRTRVIHTADPDGSLQVNVLFKKSMAAGLAFGYRLSKFFFVRTGKLRK